MKRIAAIAAAALLAGQAFAQGPPAPCLHFHTSFHLTVNAPIAEMSTLFGPISERVWVGESWNPVFIHPQPAKDIQGAVFTIRRDPSTEVWVNTLFDLKHGRFQYVYFVPGLAVSVIDIRLAPAATGRTRIEATFARTAVTPEGNTLVTSMDEWDKAASDLWQQKFGAYLATRR